MLQASWGASLTAITCVYIILCVISVCYSIVMIARLLMNKVILMDTGETPSFGPSRCFARLILSFALCLANLYEGAITEM